MALFTCNNRQEFSQEGNCILKIEVVINLIYELSG